MKSIPIISTMDNFGRIKNYDTAYFTMAAPQRRHDVIYNIKCVPNYESLKTNRTTDYWTKKHHPEKPIPERIYLLGNGYGFELRLKYSFKYNHDINKTEFNNYMRELVYQEICLVDR